MIKRLFNNLKSKEESEFYNVELSTNPLLKEFLKSEEVELSIIESGREIIGNEPTYYGGVYVVFYDVGVKRYRIELDSTTDIKSVTGFVQFTYEDQDTLYIDEINVEDKRHGDGSILMKYLCIWAKEQGIRYLKGTMYYRDLEEKKDISGFYEYWKFKIDQDKLELDLSKISFEDLQDLEFIKKCRKKTLI